MLLKKTKQAIKVYKEKNKSEVISNEEEKMTTNVVFTDLMKNNNKFVKSMKSKFRKKQEKDNQTKTGKGHLI